MNLPATHKKFLFLNAIRTDLPSGGLTSTKLFINSIKNEGEIKEVSLQPFFDKANFKLANFLLSLPLPLIVVFNRMMRLRFFEFFLRLSPFYLCSLLLTRLIYKPDTVIFNHHASFLYSILFSGVEKIFIWHDLPSLKVINPNHQKNIDRNITIGIEKLLLKLSGVNLVFSFTDRAFLSRFYKKKAYMIPVIDNKLDRRQPKVSENRLLLVGNWNRPENSEGALKFFRLYADLTKSFPKEKTKFSFNVAGSGAENFNKQLEMLELNGLDIHFTKRYEKMSDFSELGLIAPIESGAGIKLKTLEAWSASIPVIGTHQAFSGLPKRIWILGGLSMPSIESLASLCADSDHFVEKVTQLDPSQSFAQYQEVIQNEESWLQ